MAQSIYIYPHGSTAQKFILDATTLSIDNDRDIEDFKVPGKAWNGWFDNLNTDRTWTITGTFVGTGTTWNSTTCVGPRLDFIHQLACYLNGLNPSTGLQNASTAVGFDIQLNETFGGGASYNNASLFANQEILLLFKHLNIKIEGGSPSVVTYTIIFVEVGQIVNMG
jgi:hypothetical protein